MLVTSIFSLFPTMSLNTVFQRSTTLDDWVVKCQRNTSLTSILKVLHGNTKSPTGCMYTWRYNILYLTILYNTRNVSVFVCIAFKNAGDWLKCQKSAQYLQGYRKKSGKLFHRRNLLSLRQVFPWKINKVQWNSNSMWKSWWWLTCQKSAQYLQAFRKKLQKTVWSLKFTKCKVRDFAKNPWSVTQLKLYL